MKQIRLSQTEMGAGIAASPHCAERRICRSHVLSPRGPISKVQAHQLRRRFPSNNSLVRGASTVYLTAPPEGSLVAQLSSPGPKTKTVRCSAALLGSITLASRFASSVRRLPKPRRARGRSTLPAPLPDWPRATPKSLSLPVGGDRSFRHPPLPSCPCGPSGGGGDFRPDHPCTMHVGSESGKRKIRPQACG